MVIFQCRSYFWVWANLLLFIAEMPFLQQICSFFAAVLSLIWKVCIMWSEENWLYFVNKAKKCIYLLKKVKSAETNYEIPELKRKHGQWVVHLGSFSQLVCPESRSPRGHVPVGELTWSLFHLLPLPLNIISSCQSVTVLSHLYGCKIVVYQMHQMISAEIIILLSHKWTLTFFLWDVSVWGNQKNLHIKIRFLKCTNVNLGSCYVMKSQVMFYLPSQVYMELSPEKTPLQVVI